MNSDDVRLGWHFVRLKDGKPVLRDGRPVRVGRWLVHRGPVAMCESGLHASWHILDALNFVTWSDCAACLVQARDVRRDDHDKFVCTRRRAIAVVPADELLRDFVANIRVRLPDAGKYPERYGYGYPFAAVAWHAARDLAWGGGRSVGYFHSMAELNRELEELVLAEIDPAVLGALP